MRLLLKRAMQARRHGARLVAACAIAASSFVVPVAAQQPQPPKPQDEFVPVSQLPAQDQLPAAPLLVTAYAFVWVALFGYVVSVARRLTKVQREVERLEADMKRGTRA
jgi:CcmD family protein